jgi:uncharacterized repeat protein (TIGR03917 family)
MIVTRASDSDAAPNLVGVPPTEPPTPAVQLFALNRGPLVEHELIVAPGASAGDVSCALVLVPVDAALVEFGGDIDLTMVFREIPRARVPVHDAAPEEEDG